MVFYSLYEISVMSEVVSIFNRIECPSSFAVVVWDLYWGEKLLPDYLYVFFFTVCVYYAVACAPVGYKFKKKKKKIGTFCAPVGYKFF